MNEKQLVDAAATVVAEATGFFKQVRRGLPEPVARRLNNPGCIPSWCYPDGSPMPADLGIVEFERVEDGWKALRTQCRINLIKRHLTPLEFFAGKAGVYRGFAPRSPFLLCDPRALAEKLADSAGRAAGVTFPLNIPMIEVINSGGSNAQRSAY